MGSACLGAYHSERRRVSALQEELSSVRVAGEGEVQQLRAAKEGEISVLIRKHAEYIQSLKLEHQQKAQAAEGEAGSTSTI
jgi:predicted amidohydrolase